MTIVIFFAQLPTTLDYKPWGLNKKTWSSSRFLDILTEATNKTVYKDVFFL